MKSLIAALLLTLSTTASNANEYEACRDYADLLQAIAKARDVDVSPADIYNDLRDVDLSEEFIVNLLKIAYILGEDKTPAKLWSMSFKICVDSIT